MQIFDQLWARERDRLQRALTQPAMERRFSRFEIRTDKASGGAAYISGYAARFGVFSEDLGGFREKINPRAFDRSLASGADVTATFNHDPSLLLGRTKNRTLSLNADALGLWFRCQVPENTRAGVDVLAYLARRDVTECSFGFIVNGQAGQSWSRGTDPETGAMIDVRELLDVDLVDVGPVVHPAYSGDVTGVAIEAARALMSSNAVPAEIRNRIVTASAVSTEDQDRRRLAHCALLLHECESDLAPQGWNR